MESKAFSRLEQAVRKLVAQHGQLSTRSAQLAAALAKSRDEIEKLKGQNFRFRNERGEVRKKIDAVIRRIDTLGAAGEPRGTDARD